MSLENILARVESVISTNVAAEFALEDTRIGGSIVLVAPAATSYFQHEVPIVEPFAVPFVQIIGRGAATTVYLADREDDSHEVDVVYTVADMKRADLDKRVFRATYALRRLLRKFADGGSTAVWSGIIQTDILSMRFFEPAISGEGVLLRSGVVAARFRERLSFPT